MYDIVDLIRFSVTSSSGDFQKRRFFNGKSNSTRFLDNAWTPKGLKYFGGLLCVLSFYPGTCYLANVPSPRLF